MGVAELREPQVVGVEAGLLVVEVGMIAEHHADGRIDDFRRDAVALLVGHARLGIPSAAMQVLELDAEHGELLGALAGGGGQADRDRAAHPVDHEDVAEFFVAYHPRRDVFELVIDPIDVSAGRLGDV